MDISMLKDTVYSVMPAGLVEEVIVFGSMARGDMTAGSDVDICIITKNDIPFDKMRDYGGRMNRIFAFDHKIPTDILFKSRQTYDARKDVAGLVEHEINKGGHVL